MLDGEAPVVHAVRKQDQIELTASDTRSTVTGIYYAAVDDTAIMDLPEYQKYSKPITYAENTMYYFYAEDAQETVVCRLLQTWRQLQSLCWSSKTFICIRAEAPN